MAIDEIYEDMAFEKEQAERHILWAYGEVGGQQPGSFMRSLIDCFAHADTNNFNKLAKMYPEYAKAYVEMHTGALVERYKEEG